MTSVLLPRADIALWTDPGGTRVEIPHLMAVTDTRTFSGVAVQFAGDQLGTPFRGEARPRNMPLTAHFTSSEQAALLALLSLFTAAADSADSRLQLRTHYGQVVGLDETLAVTVFGVEVAWQKAMIADVTFTAVPVASTIAV